MSEFGGSRKRVKTQHVLSPSFSLLNLIIFAIKHLNLNELSLRIAPYFQTISQFYMLVSSYTITML